MNKLPIGTVVKIIGKSPAKYHNTIQVVSGYRDTWYLMKGLDDNGNNVWIIDELEVIKMPFKKSDLKTGMLLQTRDGQWYVAVIGSTGQLRYGSSFLLERDSNKFIGWLTLDRYTDDLLHASDDINHSQYDIMKIAKISSASAAFINDEQTKDLRGFEIIWYRKEVNPREQQLEELISKMQSQLNDAQAELQSLRRN